MDISRLSTWAQRYIEAETAKQKRAGRAEQKQKNARSGNLQKPRFESKLEADYYYANIQPRILAGEVASCEFHKRFDLYPPLDYSGIHLPPAHYTPDFFIEYRSGICEAVEVKDEVIRKLQKDYIYRRRLFIEKYAMPNGWIFTEFIKKKEKAK